MDLQIVSIIIILYYASGTEVQVITMLIIIKIVGVECLQTVRYHNRPGVLFLHYFIKINTRRFDQPRVGYPGLY